MKKKTIIFMIIFVISTIGFSINSKVSAFDASEFVNNFNNAVEHKKTEQKSEDIFSGADSFITSKNTVTVNGNEVAVLDTSKLKEGTDTLYNILLAIGTAVALIIGIILGIKFMMSPIEEKAKIKEALIPYVIGCIVVFGAFGIWKIIVEMVD